MSNLTQQQKKQLAALFPEYAHMYQDNEDVVSKIFAGLTMIKGEKGDKGDTGERGEAGYSPVLGKDYLTESDLKYIFKTLTPQKGIHYFDGKDGKSIKGDRGEQGERGEAGKDGKNGKDGKDAKVEIDEIVTKVTKEFKSKKLLSSKNIDMSDMRWHGGGLSQVSHDSTLTGTGSPSSPLSVVGGGGTWYQDEIVARSTTGTSFVLANTPSSVVFLYKNGQYMISGVGQDYTRSGAVITLSVALTTADILTATYS